uniref:Photosystem II reaction center protein X n=1 Tax=Rhizochromulina marina TaxID=1034831 RepID=A0A514CPR6_9STRA|nr:photosystem II subunit X [Rhizochromulina marina]QDH81790.1 photosystem II subunit X [Rhizochromulina marina]
MSASLSSFVFSLVAGAIVVLVLGVALIWVSSNDRLSRS